MGVYEDQTFEVAWRWRWVVLFNNPKWVVGSRIELAKHRSKVQHVVPFEYRKA